MILRYDVEILSRSIRAAQNLQARGYHNQLIGIVSPNTHLLAPIVFTSLYLRCPVSAADETFEATKMRQMLSIARPALMFGERSLYAQVTSEPVEILMVETGDEISFV